MKRSQHTSSFIYPTILAFIYLLTRLFNLTKLPIFTDEAIYIYWAKEIITTKSQWFLPIFDGKPPLFVWIMMIMTKLFPSDQYLLAGRCTTVLFGLLCLIGIYTLTEYLFKSKRVAIIASLFYIITPYTFFYDRMALFDTPLSAGLVWTTYFTFRTSDNPTYKNTFFWAALMGISFYLKPTALIFWAILPIIFLLRMKQMKTKIDIRKILSAILFFLIFSQLINQSMRISNAYPAFAAKNAQFQYPITSLIKDPFTHTYGSFLVIVNWISAWMTWPILGICIGGILFLLVTNQIIGIIFLFLTVIPLIGFAFFGREIFPRYEIFIAPYLFIAGAWIVEHAITNKNTIVKVLCFISVLWCLIAPIKNAYLLYTSPESSSMPQTDFDQYVKSHPSGYGVNEVITVLDNSLKDNKNITLVTEGTFGLFPYVFTLHYWQNPRVTIIPRWPMRIDTEITNRLTHGPVYVVFKDQITMPTNLNLKLIKLMPKPAGGNLPIILTQLTND
jgi:4-amino-4-deoxy-L-arabinose transferase-like glycosyltransferase